MIDAAPHYGATSERENPAIDEFAHLWPHSGPPPGPGASIVERDEYRRWRSWHTVYVKRMCEFLVKTDVSVRIARCRPHDADRVGDAGCSGSLVNHTPAIRRRSLRPVRGEQRQMRRMAK
jgi:hypothetical protein